MRFHILLRLGFLAALGALAGCHTVHVGDQDGGSTPPPDAGGAVECGAVTCDPGLVCCNASCGICTEPGGACIQVVCD